MKRFLEIAIILMLALSALLSFFIAADGLRVRRDLREADVEQVTALVPGVRYDEIWVDDEYLYASSLRGGDLNLDRWSLERNEQGDSLTYDSPRKFDLVSESESRVEEVDISYFLENFVLYDVEGDLVAWLVGSYLFAGTFSHDSQERDPSTGELVYMDDIQEIGNVHALLEEDRGRAYGVSVFSHSGVLYVAVLFEDGFLGIFSREGRRSVGFKVITYSNRNPECPPFFWSLPPKSSGENLIFFNELGEQYLLEVEGPEDSPVVMLDSSLRRSFTVTNLCAVTVGSSDMIFAGGDDGDVVVRHRATGSQVRFTVDHGQAIDLLKSVEPSTLVAYSKVSGLLHICSSPFAGLESCRESASLTAVTALTTSRSGDSIYLASEGAIYKGQITDVRSLTSRAVVELSLLSVSLSFLSILIALRLGLPWDK